jgi:hypothetical protein
MIRPSPAATEAHAHMVAEYRSRGLDQATAERLATDAVAAFSVMARIARTVAEREANQPQPSHERT